MLPGTVALFEVKRAFADAFGASMRRRHDPATGTARSTSGSGPEGSAWTPQERVLAYPSEPGTGPSEGGPPGVGASGTRPTQGADLASLEPVSREVDMAEADVKREMDGLK